MLLSAQVADLYFAYRTTLLRIDIAQQNAAIQKRSFEITEKIFKAGQDSELDLQQAKTQYLATLATITESRSDSGRCATRLPPCSAGSRANVPELASVKGDCRPMEPLDIKGIPAQLLAAPAGHPHGRLADRRTVGADRHCKSRLLPGHHAARQHRLGANSLDASPDTPQSRRRPRPEWNVFDFGRIRGNVRLQDARLQQSIEVFQNSVLQAAREIDDAAISVVKTAERQRNARRCARGRGALARACEYALSRKATRIFSG